MNYLLAIVAHTKRFSLRHSRRRALQRRHHIIIRRAVVARAHRLRQDLLGTLLVGRGRVVIRQDLLPGLGEAAEEEPALHGLEVKDRLKEPEVLLLAVVQPRVENAGVVTPAHPVQIPVHHDGGRAAIDLGEIQKLVDVEPVFGVGMPKLR